MKPSHMSHLVKDDTGGRVLAVFAKADFTAEHESGLRDIYRLMGCDPNSLEGIDSYSLKPDFIKQAMSHLSFFETAYSWRDSPGTGFRQGKLRKGKALCLRLDDYGTSEVVSDRHWRRSEDVELSVSWSWSGFEIMAYSNEAKQFAQDLYSAIKAGDFACFIGGITDNPFSRGGLTITIPSRLSQEIKDHMLSVHEEKRRLLDAAERTGLKERLDAKLGSSIRSYHSYLSLTPAWATSIRGRDEDKGGAVVTEHDVIYWLNPLSRNAKAGWYTVEEIDLWINEGAGPVTGNPVTAKRPGR